MKKVLFGFAFAVAPVSYTHLDVYKRQEYVAVREARIEALRQQLVQTGSETPEFFVLTDGYVQLSLIHIFRQFCSQKTVPG